MRRARIALALLIVLAGSAAAAELLSTEPELVDMETPPETPDELTVVGGEYPGDPKAVFERVLNLTEREVEPPIVFVEDPENESPAVYDRSRSSFRSALGIVPPRRSNDSEVQLAAYAPSDGETVHVYEGVLANETVAESVLAHEFVHVVQSRTGWWGRVRTDQDKTQMDAGEERSVQLSQDGELTYRMLIEGGASYVEHHYEDRFLPNAPGSESFGEAAYENASAHSRLNLAWYVLGAQYVNDTVDSPADLAAAYAEPPVSTEQLLHRNDDPVAELSVDAEGVGDWERQWGRERQGELFLRIALRTELNESTAGDAAHGWGNDVRLDYERGNATGTAWVIQWDDARNATEFETAFDRYLDAKATRNGSVWQADEGDATYRVRRLTNRTTVVYLGNESFVRAANATAEGDSRVEVGPRNESPATGARPLTWHP